MKDEVSGVRQILHFKSFIYGALLFLSALAVFLASPVHPLGDSRYSILVSQSLIDHRTFSLDHYFLSDSAQTPEEAFRKLRNLRSRLPYQLKVINNHIYYNYPPGSSILSLPFVAFAGLFGVSPLKANGEYYMRGERLIQFVLAGLLMAFLTWIFYSTALLLLPERWSAATALGAALGTQVWSTASRTLTSHTWGILLLGIVIRMLLDAQQHRKRINPYWLATLLSWMYFVRPTFSLAIIAISIYMLVIHSTSFIKYILVGLAWFACFLIYSLHHFDQFLPRYYSGHFMTFDSFWNAMAANLISPSRGLFVFVPVLFFIAYLLIRHFRYVKYPGLVALSLPVVAGHLIVISGSAYWWGGNCYGPRLATDLVPWFVLLAILGIDAGLTCRREFPQVARRMGMLLLLVSLLIHSHGAFSTTTLAWNAVPERIDANPNRVWDWKRPQFLAGLVFEVSSPTEPP